MSRNRHGLISFPNTKVLCLMPLRREGTFGLQLGIFQLAPIRFRRHGKNTSEVWGMATRLSRGCERRGMAARRLGRIVAV